MKYEGTEIDNQIINLLFYLKTYKKRKIKDLKKSLVTVDKIIMDKYGDEESKKYGWNICGKITSIINKSEERGFVNLKEKNFIRITKKGRYFLKLCYSDNYSEEFLKFAKIIQGKCDEFNMPMIHEEELLHMFHNEFSGEVHLNKFDKFLLNYKEFQPFSEYIHHLLKLNNIQDSKDIYIFNLRPELHVPIRYISSNVDLKIVCDKSVCIPDNMIITRPYVNGTFFVAGQQFENEISAGIFPIACKKENFPDNLYLELHWTIDNVYKIIHKVNIQFDKTRKFGNFFSTNQRFSYQLNIDDFELVSEIKEDSYEESKYTKKIKRKDYIELIENITLSNFPIEYQQLYADIYASKYKEKNSKNFV